MNTERFDSILAVADRSPADSELLVKAARLARQCGARVDEFLQQPRVAYFSMEIALRSEIPTYAGGLGILAGAILRAAADLSLPLVAVTLVSRAGYFRHALSANGAQTEHADRWDPASWSRRLDAKVAVRVADRPVLHETASAKNRLL